MAMRVQKGPRKIDNHTLENQINHLTAEGNDLKVIIKNPIKLTQDDRQRLGLKKIQEANIYTHWEKNSEGKLEMKGYNIKIADGEQTIDNGTFSIDDKDFAKNTLVVSPLETDFKITQNQHFNEPFNVGYMGDVDIDTKHFEGRRLPTEELPNGIKEKVDYTNEVAMLINQYGLDKEMLSKSSIDEKQVINHYTSMVDIYMQTRTNSFEEAFSKESAEREGFEPTQFKRTVAETAIIKSYSNNVTQDKFINAMQQENNLYNKNIIDNKILILQQKIEDAKEFEKIYPNSNRILTSDGNLVYDGKRHYREAAYENFVKSYTTEEELSLMNKKEARKEKILNLFKNKEATLEDRNMKRILTLENKQNSENLISLEQELSRLQNLKEFYVLAEKSGIKIPREGVQSKEFLNRLNKEYKSTAEEYSKVFKALNNNATLTTDNEAKFKEVGQKMNDLSKMINNHPEYSTETSKIIERFKENQSEYEIIEGDAFKAFKNSGIRNEEYVNSIKSYSALTAEVQTLTKYYNENEEKAKEVIEKIKTGSKDEKFKVKDEDKQFLQEFNSNATTLKNLRNIVNENNFKLVDAEKQDEIKSFIKYHNNSGSQLKLDENDLTSIQGLFKMQKEINQRIDSLEKDIYKKEDGKGKQEPATKHTADNYKSHLKEREEVHHLNTMHDELTKHINNQIKLNHVEQAKTVDFEKDLETIKELKLQKESRMKDVAEIMVINANDDDKDNIKSTLEKETTLERFAMLDDTIKQTEERINSLDDKIAENQELLNNLKSKEKLEESIEKFDRYLNRLDEVEKELEKDPDNEKLMKEQEKLSKLRDNLDTRIEVEKELEEVRNIENKIAENQELIERLEQTKEILEEYKTLCNEEFSIKDNKERMIKIEEALNGFNARDGESLENIAKSHEDVSQKLEELKEVIQEEKAVHQERVDKGDTEIADAIQSKIDNCEGNQKALANAEFHMSQLNQDERDKVIQNQIEKINSKENEVDNQAEQEKDNSKEDTSKETKTNEINELIIATEESLSSKEAFDATNEEYMKLADEKEAVVTDDADTVEFDRSEPSNEEFEGNNSQPDLGEHNEDKDISEEEPILDSSNDDTENNLNNEENINEKEEVAEEEVVKEEVVEKEEIAESQESASNEEEVIEFGPEI